MYNLKIIIASTRPTRQGPAVAYWLAEEAKKHTDFKTELVDLKDVNLPVFDEPKHPRFGEYEHEHTKRWSALMADGEAFIVVTPEYNYTYPPSLLNALTYLVKEWKYKPMALASYGGMSGGLRAQQALKMLVTTFNMMPLAESVAIPNFGQHINDEGKFVPYEAVQKSADAVFKELLKWAKAMKTMREENQ
jgi:NAD(P)H-dependent FMN reductase